MTHVETHKRRCIELEQLILKETVVNPDLEISFLRRSRDSAKRGEDRHSYSTVEGPDNANLGCQLASHLGGDRLLLLLYVINCIQGNRLIEWIVSTRFHDTGWSA